MGEGGGGSETRPMWKVDGETGLCRRVFQTRKMAEKLVGFGSDAEDQKLAR